MSNEKIANIYLSASGKGQEVDGNTLLIKDVVRLYPTLCTVYSNTTAKFGFVSPLNGKSIEHIPTPEGFPFISSEKYSNYYYYRSCLRKGYIYIYIERYEGKGFFKEFEVSDEGFLTNLIWLTKDEWRSPKRDKNVRYISINRKIHKNIWLVYSPLRWSMDYANNLLNDENKRNKRMQKLDCENCFSGNFDKNGFSVKDAAGQIMVTSPSSKNDSSSTKSNSSAKSFNDWDDEQAKAFYERQFNVHELNYALKKNDENNCDFYFMLYDPQGVADALCVDKGIEMERLNNMVESIKSVRGKTANSINTNEESELSALVDLGVVIYRMLNEKAGLFSKYRKYVSEELLKKVLLVDERKIQHDKIKKIVYALAQILKSEAYQLSCQDYTVEDQEINQEGKAQFSKHLNILLLTTDTLDGIIDNSMSELESISKNDPIIESCINILLSKKSNTGILMRLSWDLDSIVTTSLSLSTKTASSLEDIVCSLIYAYKYVKKSKNVDIFIEALNFKSKDGQQYIKLPERKIPDNLEKKVDLSKLKTTTIKNEGKGFLINLDNVTYEGKKLSDSLSKYRGKEVVLSLETIMPNWKNQLMKIKNKNEKWIRGFNNLINHSSFLNAMSGIAFLNLTLTIQNKKKDLNDYLDIFGTTAYLMTLNEKAIQQVIPKSMGKFVSKAILSKTTTAFFVLSSFYDAYNLFIKNQAAIGTLAIISAVTGGLGTFVFAGPCAWALIIISIATAIIIELIRDTDLQLLLKNSAYGTTRKLVAQSGCELLVKAMKINESNAELKPYIHNQNYTFNSLVYIMQNVINAKVKFLYDSKKRLSGQTTIFDSINLQYIDIELGIWCKTLLTGKIDVLILALDKQRTIIKEIEVSEHSIVDVDAIRGVVRICYFINHSSDNYNPFKSCNELKLVVRIKENNGKEYPSYSNSTKDSNSIAFYFPYNNSISWELVTEFSGGVKKDKVKSPNTITREGNYNCYTPSAKTVKIEFC